MLAVNEENLHVIEQALRGGNNEFTALARAIHADKTVAIRDICAALGVGRTTFYRYLKVPQGKAPSSFIPKTSVTYSRALGHGSRPTERSPFRHHTCG